jgi:hypothetical protein
MKGSEGASLSASGELPFSTSRLDFLPNVL